jgi:hypothetical protein
MATALRRDMLAAARSYVTPLAQLYDPRRLARSGYDLLRDVSESVGDMQGLSRRLLDYFRTSERQMLRETNRVDELRHTYALVQRKHRTAGLAASCALCGTLALDFDRFTMLGFPAVSLTFYAAAAMFAVSYLAGRRREP